mmetsp:Transcript_90879/g.261883  ORF Transcript_90879/g.261883 Transcript_90879/m.261883 type:complete len:402 (-) Transcript_90879:1379-2584(-)
MQHELHEQLARLGLAEGVNGFPRREFVRVLSVEVPRGIQYLGIHLVHHLHLLDHREVLRIIGVQNGVDADLAHLAKLLLLQRRENAALGLGGELEQPRAMHILEGRAVVVAERKLMRRLDEEGVVQPRMPDIMADSADEQGVPLATAEASVPGADPQQPVHAMRDVDGVEPVVIWASLDVPGLRDLQEAGHHHGVEVYPVVVRTHEVHGSGMVPRLVELQRVQVDRVQQVEGQTRILHHRALRIEHLLEVVLVLLALVLGVPRVGVGLRRALEALDHGPISLAEALHRLRVDHGLVHCDLAQHCKLLHHLLQELCFVPEGVAAEMLLVVVVLRIVLVAGLRVILDSNGHICDRLEDRGGHLANLEQQLLQRPQHDRGDGVGQHKGEADHEQHDNHKEDYVH